MIGIYLNLEEIELILTKLIDEKQKLARLKENQRLNLLNPSTMENDRKLIQVENLIKEILYWVKNNSQKNEKVSQVQNNS